MSEHIRYVALGGCNTIGEVYNIGNAYPERIAKIMNWHVENYGYTMCSTREGVQFFNLKDCQTADILSIQYGGVDSWLTFNGSPYVLYYPDNFFRKIVRKIVKKIKKIARTLKIHNLLGSVNIVPIQEYRQNLQYMIAKSQARIVLLIDTYPNEDMTREPRIIQYNQVLEELSDGKRVFYVKNYQSLKDNFKINFDDSTHLSSIGHDIIVKECLEIINYYFNKN
nr:GDSL-type esterase/lipase family protein [Acinetobacter sp. Marseille-Q1620]